MEGINKKPKKLRPINSTRLKEFRGKEVLTEDENKELRKYFLDFQSNQWEKILEGDHKKATLYVESITNYFQNVDKTVDKRPEVGTIYYFNFLMGFNKEAAYIHPALILTVLGNMFFVVPGTSLERFEEDVYDKDISNSDNSNNKMNYLLKKEFTGLKNDTVFLLHRAVMVPAEALNGYSQQGSITKDNFLVLDDIKNYLSLKLFPKMDNK